MKVKPLDLDKILGKTKSRIYLVGIELEGGWKKLPDGAAPTHDGSITFDDAELGEYRIDRYGTPRLVGGLHIGEIPSEPMDPAKVAPWMEKYYPSHVNNTCGLHVHMSFKRAFHYSRLMTPEYPATILAYVTKWAKEEGLPENHPIWGRLAGKSRYCQHVFSADLQAQVVNKDHDQRRTGHRYTVINYCYNRGTVECRLLPMMEKADQGIRAVKNILDITNAFLAISSKREEKLNVGVEASHGDKYVELRHEYV